MVANKCCRKSKKHIFLLGRMSSSDLLVPDRCWCWPVLSCLAEDWVLGVHPWLPHWFLLFLFCFVCLPFLDSRRKKNEAADQQAWVGQTAAQSGNATFLHYSLLAIL